MPSLIDEHTPYQGTDGKPLVNGKLYIGVQNQDPVSNPITIYSDRALTTSITNPQTLDSYGRTTNKIWVPGAYSLRVDNSADVQQYQELDNGSDVPFTLGTPQATTSGTQADFTGIPSGVKEVVVTIEGLALSGTDHLLIQLGDAGGFESTGYSGWSSALVTTPTISNVLSTAGFACYMNGAASLNGSIAIRLSNATNNTWNAMGVFGSGASSMVVSAGYKDLSGELDSIRITPSGSDTFTGGEVNIIYQ